MAEVLFDTDFIGILSQKFVHTVFSNYFYSTIHFSTVALFFLTVTVDTGIHCNCCGLQLTIAPDLHERASYKLLRATFPAYS